MGQINYLYNCLKVKLLIKWIIFDYDYMFYDFIRCEHSAPICHLGWTDFTVFVVLAKLSDSYQCIHKIIRGNQSIEVVGKLKMLPCNFIIERLTGISSNYFILCLKYWKVLLSEMYCYFDQLKIWASKVNCLIFTCF